MEYMGMCCALILYTPKEDICYNVLFIEIFLDIYIKSIINYWL